MPRTREPQYDFLLDIRDKKGITPLGLMSNQVWHDDPRRLAFTLARYKFVSKMMSGRSHVLEIGCADAFASRIVLQEVNKLTALDFDPVFIADIENRRHPVWPVDARFHDILGGHVNVLGGRILAGQSEDDAAERRIAREAAIAAKEQHLVRRGVLGSGAPGHKSLDVRFVPAKKRCTRSWLT